MQPNIYSIIGRNMILDVFSIPQVIPRIQQDLKNGYIKNAHWKIVKDWNVWLAALIDECNEFRKNKAQETEDAITTGFVYDVFFAEGEPKLVHYSHILLDITVEGDDEEENDEEVISDQVNGAVVYWFNKQTGDLRKIEVEEDLTGEQWEIWPDIEDFTSEMIYVDREIAEAEGLI